MVFLTEIDMDGQWPQQNSNAHTQLDLTVASPVDFNVMLQDLGDDMDALLGFEADTNTGNTSAASAAAASAAAADQGNNGNQRTQWSRKRHNREQIQELEAVFRENHHPDEIQRRDLSIRLGITETQVKFWFQNRRSYKRAQEMRQNRDGLREVNAALQAERRALRAAAEKNTCLKCGGQTVRSSEARQQLLSDNETLRDQLRRANAYLMVVSGGTAEGTSPAMLSGGSHGPATTNPNVGAGKGLMTDDHAPPPPPYHGAHADAGCTSCSERDTKAMLITHADRALAEFRDLVYSGTLMWLPTPHGEVLNFRQYIETMFPSIFGPYRTGAVLDGTRKAGEVMCTAENLVGILMDAARWSEMFPGIVVSAAASPIVTPSASQHRIIQLMDAELRVLSPGVPLRKLKFVRQCRKVQPGIWAVVDVSVDGILGQDTASRLLPSGCLIQETNNSSCCKVTWIINMEYDENTVSPLYHPLIRSGKALGACHWLSSLQRQCLYLAILHSNLVPAADLTPDGRKNLFETAQQMTRNFYEAMCGSGDKTGTSVNGWRGGCGIGFERFEVFARVVSFSANSSAPGSVVLRATATVWLPGIPAQQVFEYLCNGYRRGEWDSFANGAPILEEGCFANGQLPGNAISILRTIAPGGTNDKLILQDARTDPSCMVLAYARLDDQSMQHALNNGGPASFSLLPSGLVILPDGHSELMASPVSTACSSSNVVSRKSNAGCFVSIMYQTLMNDQPAENPSLETIDNAGNLLCRVIRRIKDAVHANSVVDA